MTTRSPRSRCQSNRRRRRAGGGGQVVAGRSRSADLVDPVDASTPARTRSNSSSLVSVGRRPADQRAVGQAGGQRRGGGHHRRPPGAAPTRKPKTLPPSVRVPSKSKAATSGIGGVPARQGRSVGGRRPSRRGRRPTANRPAPAAASGERQAVEAEAELDAPGRPPTGRPHWSRADSRSLRRQVWGRAASSWPQATARVQGRSRRHHPVDQAHGQRLFGAHLPAGEDEVEGPALADQPGEPDRAAVDEGHAEAAAEDAEGGVGGGHPQVAPDGQLQAAGHGVALDGGDHRLGQLQAGRPHRARARPRPPGAGRRRPAALRSAPAQNVPPAAGEHGHRGGVVGVEGGEGLEQGRRRWPGRRRCAAPAGRWSPP